MGACYRRIEGGATLRIKSGDRSSRAARVGHRLEGGHRIRRNTHAGQASPVVGRLTNMHDVWIVANAPPPPRGRMANNGTQAFHRPSVSVEVIFLSAFDEALWTLLRRRSESPFRGRHAIPGGFLQGDESLDDAARRILREQTGLKRVYVEQLYTFGAPRRDPRGRAISVVYYPLAPRGRLPMQDAFTLARLHVPWEGDTGGPVGAWADGGELGLAFDHAAMLGMA